MRPILPTCLLAALFILANAGTVLGEAPATITFVAIPAGSFQMGDTENVGFTSERPVHKATLSGFDISSCEITNAQYAEYLNEALTAKDITAIESNVKGAQGAYTGKTYLYLNGNHDDKNKCWIRFKSGAFTVDAGKENLPVVFITWFGAASFAHYYGLDLPTESEWEYACRGGKQLTYGTDDGTISKTNVNYDASVGNPVEVGSYPANPYGLKDMSGNVWEWCDDWYGRYPDESVKDSHGPETGFFRIIRGGGWKSYINECRSAYRFHYAPDFGYYDLGFRVVRRGKV